MASRTCFRPRSFLNFGPRLSSAVLAAVALSACAQTAPAVPADADSAAAVDAVSTSTSATAATASALNGMLLYELLVGEMSAQEGDSETAVALLLDAARQTRSEPLYRRAADIALRSRSGPRALVAAQAWQQAFPDSRDANRYVLQILLMLNRVSDTLEPLSRELAATPAGSKAAVYLAIAQLYRHVSDKNLAVAVVEQALQADLHHIETSAAAWAMLGHMRLMAGQKTLALEAASQAQQQDPASGAAALLALELMEAGTESAESIVHTYLQHDPVPSVRLAYARILIDQQRLRQARTELDAVLAQAPDLAEAWLSLAAVHAQLGQWEESEQALEGFVPYIAQMEEPQQRSYAQQQASTLGARAALQTKDYARAQYWLDQVRDGSNLLSIQSLRAAVLAHQGQLAQARKLIQEVPSQSTEQNRRKLQAEVYLLRDVGAYGQAYALQSQLQQQFPEDADITYETALLAEKIGLLDRMEQLLRSVMARHPDYHHAYNALGYSLADRAVQLDEARRLIEKALEYAPDDPFITDSLGWLEFRQGNLPLALTLLERAYGLRDDVEIATHLGEVLWASGQQERARTLWRDALVRDADNAVLRETLQRLKVVP